MQWPDLWDDSALGMMKSWNEEHSSTGGRAEDVGERWLKALQDTLRHVHTVGRWAP